MLKRIRIRNFQNLQDLKINLDPKITAIVGPSDVGKSAVLRAMRWLATNRPLGNGFIRRGENQSTVRLWSDQGKIERKRGDDVNTYKVDGRVLEAFGADVPNDVFNALRVDDVNFQGQHESPFWFALSAGEVAKQLNAIVDLSMVDDVMKDLASKLRTAKAEVSVVEEVLKQANEEYESTEYVVELDIGLKRIESIDAKRQVVKQQSSDLNRAIDDYVECRDRCVQISDLITSGEEVVEIGEAIREATDSYMKLYQWLSEAEECQELVNAEIPDTVELEELSSERNRVRSDLGNLSTMMNSYSDVYDSLTETCQKLYKLQDELAAVKQCPLCGGKLR